MIDWNQNDWKSMRNRAKFLLIDIKFVEQFMAIEARFWSVDIKKHKNFRLSNARFWLIDTFETQWLDWMSFVSARLNSISILIFSHVKINWLRKLLFLFTFFHF